MKCQGQHYIGQWPRPCPREAKEGGTLCGPHLAGRRKREQAQQAAREKWDADYARQQRLNAARRSLFDAAASCPHCGPAYRTYQDELERKPE